MTYMDITARPVFSERPEVGPVGSAGGSYATNESILSICRPDQ